MFILGANSAGLANKKESFERYLNLFLPGVFFIQESKLRKKNKIKHPNYITFEYLRENNNGGGTYFDQNCNTSQLFHHDSAFPTIQILTSL